jgi:hypothetical protein
LIWDVGYLTLIGERLCYLGDRSRFTLDRASVRDIYLGPGVPGWWKPKRIYLAWQDDARGVGGTINLGAMESRPFWRRGSNTAELEKRLREWLRQPAAADEPPPLRELPGPDFGAVASQSLAKLASFGNLMGLWILRIPFALVACLLLGLSFDPDAGAGAWYVLLTVALMEAAYVLSFLRYRDKADDSGDADALAVPAAIDPETSAR